ncbi:oligopeptide transport system substrate-binding protein [Actinocrispum wychmicini]|uniref:Oligopeptide transport system substrate-binding protein n=2 Tax=Actinocrispum wychmicini TaxID=1213861 RepID=A0A4R2JBV4_9PSEU|nr:oligopeptide transport system substrate-binding protein [Actinocrispum wychmicini]
MVLIAAVLAASACSSTDKPAPEPGVLSVGIPNPVIPGDRMLSELLFTPLVDYDPTNGKVTPRAAQSVTSTDLITWTVKLSPGTYSDGRPVTAQSYVDAWQRGLGLPVKQLTAVDEQTVQIVLTQAFSEVPAYLAAPLALPYRADDPMVGNGPYRLASPWQPGKGGRLVPLHERPGKPTAIDLRVYTDPAAAYDAVKAGTLDMTVEVPGSRHDAMHADFANSHLIWAEPALGYLAFGDDLPEAAARFAISMSVDRKGLAAGAMDNQVDPATALIPPAIAPGERSGACRACNNDVAAAKSLREQAGLTAARFDGEPRALADQVHAALGVDIAAGPTVTIQTVQLRTLSPYELLQQLKVPAVQQFLDAAATSGDFTERAQQYRLAENQILRDLPVAPLWSAHGHAVWGPRVKDVIVTAAHGIDLAATTL